MNLFLFFAILCGVAITGEYSITRPASNALFLTTFTAQGYPWVWMATVPLNFLIIYLYNQFLPRLGPLKVMATLIFLAIGINTLTGLFVSSYPQWIFVQYAWKDVYILLMFKQLWSMIHMTIPSTKAKTLYGVIYGMGTIGSIAGSLIPGFFAVDLGTEQLLFFTIPLYLALFFFYSMALQRSGVTKNSFADESGSNLPSTSGFSLIYRSPYLVGILLLVVFMQVSVALVEYQFNANLEVNILDKDLRTAYCGQIGALINALSLFFQFVGGFLMVHLLGLRRSHFLIPILLGVSALTTWAIPSFALVSFSFAFLKSVDFSLFGVIREMLYIPLKMSGKFQAKAVIDVFAYRTSKALVSLLILGLQAFVGMELMNWIQIASLSIFVAWIFVVSALFRFDQKTWDPSLG